ncbi:hypothetical protein [Thermophilibacter immobilis]|uniref:Uncharacterized protein n=1 Tax=Thermophilibacter immobilis TaxID=2779519 RepID=A0A7S7RUD6_9ACTN|nr:hypothetical protein [Thermophilibacter immobilis]QOY60347.1 hypothetical protein INP52_08030 [Thermophilibacter immobilis]
MVVGHMEPSKLRTRLACASFFSGYGLWLIWKLVSISMLSVAEGSVFNTMTHALVYGLILISILMSISMDVSLILFVITAGIGIAVKIAAGDVLLLDTALILYAGRKVEFKKIAWFTLYLIGAGSVVIVVLSQFGVIPDYLFKRGSEAVRHGLGFRYCTYLSHIYLNLVMLHLYVRDGKLPAWQYIGIIIINILIFIFTDSRNSFALVLLLMIGTLCLSIFRQRPWLGSCLRSLAKYSFVAFSVIGLVMALVYDSSTPAWKALNSLSSNRLAQDHASLNKYGIKPFGQEIEFAGNSLVTGGSLVSRKESFPEADKNYIESSYLNTLVLRGLVPFLAVLVAFSVASREAASKDDLLMCLILFVIAAHSAFDPQLLNLLYSTFLFWVWQECSAFFRKISMECAEKNKRD